MSDPTEWEMDHDARSDFEDVDDIEWEKDVLRHFPYPGFRTHQKEAILQIARAIDEGKHVLVEAPVGSGKSSYAVTLARWSGSAIVTTPVNALVDQYDDEFGKVFPVLKGRVNYPCHINGKTGDVGACILKKMPDGTPWSKDDVCECPYAKAKTAAEASPFVMTNLAMAAVARFLRDDRRIVVVDEAHNLEATLTGQVSPSLNKDKFTQRPPEDNGWDAHYAWLSDCAIPEVLAEIERLRPPENGPVDEVQKKEFDAAESLARQLTDLQRDFDKEKEPWIVSQKQQYQKEYVNYKPLTGSRFIKSMIMSHGDQTIFMSGTPPTLRELGLKEEEVARVTVPMTFPLANRPVQFTPVGKMSYLQRDKTIPKMAAKIAELTPGAGPTLVHCHSYDIANKISDQLYRMGTRHILQNPRARQDSLDDFLALKGDKDAVFLSVNFAEGINLKDDHCRLQILCKVPYPNLEDPWQKQRNLRIGEDPMLHQIARTIVQMYGRAVRSETDWSRFIILDSFFNYFYSQNRSKFASYFRDAVDAGRGGRQHANEDPRPEGDGVRASVAGQPATWDPSRSTAKGVRLLDS